MVGVELRTILQEKLQLQQSQAAIAVEVLERMLEGKKSESAAQEVVGTLSDMAKVAEELAVITEASLAFTYAEVPAAWVEGIM